MAKINERLDQILPRIKEEGFMQGRGLGNEIGYYVFDYNSEDEILVRDYIGFVKDKMNNNSSYPDIAEFDLYELMLEVLEDKGYLEKTIEMEKKQGSERVLKAIKRSLRLPGKNNLLIQEIKNNTEDDNIVFLTGIGKAWPIIRSHTILNNLHPVLDNIPVVMFFPGKYDGSSLILFNKIKDDNYYRAFRLVE